MGGGAKFLELLASEDVDGDKVNLGVTVLAGLGGGHLDNLAGTVLDDDEAVLPQGRALHGVGERGAGVGALEGVLMLLAQLASCGHCLDALVRSALARQHQSIKGGAQRVASVEDVPGRRRPLCRMSVGVMRRRWNGVEEADGKRVSWMERVG